MLTTDTKGMVRTVLVNDLYNMKDNDVQGI